MKQKNYKEKLSLKNMEKRGQATVFVIIALVVVAAVAIAFFLLPENIRGSIRGELNPNAFLRECIEPSIIDTSELLSRQGGYTEPEGYLIYEDEKVKYLCYTAEYYKTCVVQQPLLVSQFERELEKVGSGKAAECSQSLREAYESRGYSVSGSGSEAKVELVPGAIRVNFDLPLTVSREGESQSYDGFEINIESEMYDLLLISQSIIEFETTYGDSDSLTYLAYYPDLSIEKVKLGEGSTVYTVSDVTTEESFRFASRSLVWPPGFGN